MSRASERPRLWLPQRWPMWIALGLFRLANRLPWSAQRSLARALGAFVYHVVPIRRHVTLVNLRLCFPEKSPGEVRALARAHYQSLALGLFETCTGWWTPAQKLPPHTIVGREHLERAIAEDRLAPLRHVLEQREDQVLLAQPARVLDAVGDGDLDELGDVVGLELRQVGRDLQRALGHRPGRLHRFLAALRVLPIVLAVVLALVLPLRTR